MSKDSFVKVVKKELGWRSRSPESLPLKLRPKRWNPRYVFFHPNKKVFILVDIVIANEVAPSFYADALKDITTKAKVHMCLFSPATEPHDKVATFCRQKSIPFKIFTEQIVATVVPLDFEEPKTIEVPSKPAPDIWFPPTILNRVTEVSKFNNKTCGILRKCAKGLSSSRSHQPALNIVKDTIDDLLRLPGFLGDSLPFMRLEAWEHFLSLDGDQRAEHTFHSFRVFLIGCVILDRYFDYYRNYFVTCFPGMKNFSLDYTWLLASIFHDIGRVEQQMPAAVLGEYTEIKVNGRWKDQIWRQALNNVVALVEHLSEKKITAPFVGAALQDQQQSPLAKYIMSKYNNLESHSVIGALNMATDLMNKTQGAGRHRDSAFNLYHIFPAAVSILLHDWHLWKDLRASKLEAIFPLRAERHPLAALLIFCDTWDDYKRRPGSHMLLKNLLLEKDAVIAEIEWLDQEKYNEEKFKYENYEKNVIQTTPKLKIKVSNVSGG